MRTNERKNLIYIYCLCIFICVLLSFAVSMRIMKGLADGFEQANGHKEYKKLNSELKAAISMYSKNLNKSANFIEN